MTGPATTRPDEATRRAARRLAVLSSVLMVGALVAQILYLHRGTREVTLLLSVGFGVALLSSLWTLQAGGSLRVLVGPVVLMLDVGAVVAGALLPIALDIAVLLPLLSAILLVAVFEGRRLHAGLLAGWVAGVVGAAFARSSPGLAGVPDAVPPALAVAFLAGGTALGYLALAWASTHWHAVAAESRAAAEQARLAEIAQRRSAERSRALIDVSPLPTIAFDAEGLIRAWNPAAERYLGWTAEEILGQPLMTLLPERARHEAALRAKRTLATGKVPGQRLTTFRVRDGIELRAEIHDAIEWGIDGKPSGVVVQFIDVTEREALAERLAEAQRMEAVGQLAGGVAHDFNNSLTAIAGFASLIASGESPDPRDDARTILGAAEHAAILTRQLLAFSRRVPLQPQTLDMREFLATVEPLVRSLVGETIVLRRETDGRPALVEVDPATLEQAILNLAANARDAMPQGGELTLAVKSYPGCAGGSSQEAEDHVAVVVSDTGTGIDPSVINRIFEPFFTTKPQGKGTGLGLPMVHGFVAQSGGHVVVTSPVGQGATLELHFRHSDASVSRAEVRAQAIGGKETILFVEDDPGVASFGLACLRRLGYDVTPAMNGTEAVALASSRSEPFDLLLTDVVIPGMSGSELAVLVHRHHPGTAILYASGYSAEHVDSLVMGPRAPLLEKPYSLDQLASKVRAALDGRSGATD
jgi:two-component system cell cycle sensor histidine kinase/response regulator CckA